MSACTRAGSLRRWQMPRVGSQTPAVGHRWSVTFREGAAGPDLLLLEVRLRGMWSYESTRQSSTPLHNATLTRESSTPLHNAMLTRESSKRKKVWKEYFYTFFQVFIIIKWYFLWFARSFISCFLLQTLMSVSNCQRWWTTCCMNQFIGLELCLCVTMSCFTYEHTGLSLLSSSGLQQINICSDFRLKNTYRKIWATARTNERSSSVGLTDWSELQVDYPADDQLFSFTFVIINTASLPSLPPGVKGQTQGCPRE